MSHDYVESYATGFGVNQLEMTKLVKVECGYAYPCEKGGFTIGVTPLLTISHNSVRFGRIGC